MRLLLLLAAAAIPVHAQDKSEARELIGKMGTRNALLILHRTERANGGWQVAGEGRRDERVSGRVATPAIGCLRGERPGC